jgi:serine/threonine protein kinase/Tfp pilus assembly protein PilF
MSKKSTFGARPEQLNRLLSAIGLDKPNADEQGDQTASLETSAGRLGGQIGRYKLLRVLGEGGMGIVCLAEQERPIRRQVALKIIKPGMDSKRVIARFEAERQALALLDHPNIAHVYDAGTTENGRPYFVMEYVKGLPITEHCDRQKLTIEDRLKSFLQVCHAVHHAHQKGIIHRDIKPSNILVSTVDDQVIPKIIDFGVAKAVTQPLTEHTLFTEDSQLLGTPEYMSPEQADMASEDIDTRSDIYSLGVLLYVLLTGVLPFDSDTLREGGLDHVRKVIRETDPKTPSTRLTKLGEDAKRIAKSRRTEVSTLARRLHRELEWIPLKAMRKERSERYRSASELSDDIENYLRGEPLIAGPLTTGYRLRKFLRRHKALVSGIAVVSAVIISGAVISTIFAIRAEHQANIAQAVADFLRNDLIASAGPGKSQGREVTIRSFLDIASENLKGKFNNEPLIEASIRQTLGWTYRGLGESEKAEPHFERALEINLEQLGQEHPETLNSMLALGWLRCDQSRNAEAKELLLKALAISRRTLGDGSSRTLNFINVLTCVYVDLGRYNEAEQLASEGIKAGIHSLGEKNQIILWLIGNLGQVYEAQGRYEEAERQYIETLRLRDGVWDDDGVWTLVYKSFLARNYRKQKHYEQAEKLYLEILPIQQRDLTKEHPYTLWSIEGLARVYMHLNKHNEAEKLFAEALEGLQKVQGMEHRDTIRCMNGLGELYMSQHRFDEAETILRNALESSRHKLGNDHTWTLTSMNGLAVVYKEQAQYEKAEPLLLEATKGRIEKLKLQHPHTRESIDNLIDLYETWNKPEEIAKWRQLMSDNEQKTIE